MTPDELKSYRAELGLTQKQLGEWLRLSGAQPGHTVRMWEMGRSRVPGPAEVAILAFSSEWRPPAAG
jgi:DNA-binding transcriptional regulator YiaG